MPQHAPITVCGLDEQGKWVFCVTLVRNAIVLGNGVPREG